MCNLCREYIEEIRSLNRQLAELLEKLRDAELEVLRLERERAELDKELEVKNAALLSREMEWLRRTMYR